MRERDDSFYKNNDDFWKSNDDSFWNSDSGQFSDDKEKYSWYYPEQQQKNNLYEESQNREYPKPEYSNLENQRYGNIYNSGYQMDKEMEHKANIRTFGKIALVCGIIIAIAIILSVFGSKSVKNKVVKNLKQLDFTTNTYKADEWLLVKTCDVKVSDAFVAFDSENDVWMPSGKKIIGVNVEIISGEYISGGGVTDPYLRYGEYYCYPITDNRVKEVIIKAGYAEEDFLSIYGAGSLDDEEGFYFFLVDSDADDFSFIIDEKERENRIEYLRVRNIVDIDLKENIEEGTDYE